MSLFACGSTGSELTLIIGFRFERGITMKAHSIKEQIVAALSHPEAEDGLYFNNLIIVHEEEERPIVEGEETIILQVLDDMVGDGLVCVSGEGAQRIYSLVTQ